MPGQSLYTLDVDTSGEVSLTSIADPESVPSGLAHLISFPIDGQMYLFGADSSGNALLFRLLPAAPFLSPGIPVPLDVGRFDRVRAFLLADRTYLITYTAESGDLNFFSLDSAGKVSKPYRYYRKRQPGLTSGWSTFETLNYLNLPYFLAYSDDTGDVELFGISATSASVADTPPLICNNVWSWTWAKGWGNFAFFQLGGENFFFKINRPYPNINIDHLSIDPASRSNEVGTHLQLADWQKVNIVHTLSLDQGAPFLLAYQASGKLAFHRIFADCQGWCDQAPIPVAANVSQIVTYRLDSQSFALFY